MTCTMHTYWHIGTSRNTHIKKIKKKKVGLDVVVHTTLDPSSQEVEADRSLWV